MAGTGKDGGISVLIIEDSIVFREFLRMAVEKNMGIAVVYTANDAYDGKEKIMQHDPDVILLDINMPKMNGLEFMKKLMRQYPIPIICVSSHAEFAGEAIKAGAVDFIEKPGYGADRDVDGFYRSVIDRVKAASRLKIKRSIDSIRKAGTAGKSGKTGKSGVAGMSGTASVAGTAGATGTASVAGTASKSGAASTTGTAGTAGVAGVADSANMAGTVSMAGATGTASVTGTASKSGAASTTGTAGTAGVVGVADSANMACTAGTVGVAGAAGVTGIASTVGATGTAGKVSTAGATGAGGNRISEPPMRGDIIGGEYGLGKAAHRPRPKIYKDKINKADAGGGKNVHSVGGAAYWKKPTDKVVIAIGASTGGTEAIASLVSSLPAGLPCILIVQHMPQDFTAMFAERLDSICRFESKEAKNGDIIAPNTALVAPGNYQLRMVKKGSSFAVSVVHGEKVSGHSPSVDVMFSSVAESAGAKAIGVILTGMGQDGAEGLLKMRVSGARTIGQDEGTCVVYGMPKVAYEKGAVMFQLPLEQIAAKILELL